MSATPLAVRLADALQAYWGAENGHDRERKAAAELRRLYAINQELLEALKSITEMYGYEDSNIELARKFYEAKCIAGVAIAKATGGTA